MEIDPVFSPGALIRNQFELQATPRMKGMNYLKSLLHNVALRRSCHPRPMDASNGSSARSKTTSLGPYFAIWTNYAKPCRIFATDTTTTGFWNVYSIGLPLRRGATFSSLKQVA